jgi:hypothetical protein
MMLAKVASRLNTATLSDEWLAPNLSPNPQRGFFSSLKFCSICILRLYNFIACLGEKSVLFVKINQGDFPAVRALAFTVVLTDLSFERLNLRPFGLLL